MLFLRSSLASKPQQTLRFLFISRYYSMASSSALPETLRSITATKIAEVVRQQEQYEARKLSITDSAAETIGLLPKVDILLRNLCDLNGVLPESKDDEERPHRKAYTGYNGSLQNQQQLLLQAKSDPSFSGKTMQRLGDGLLKHLDLESVKLEHAHIFSRLVTEWLSNPQNPADQDVDTEARYEESHDKVTTETSSESFQEVGRKEMHEQRATWEELVFGKPQVEAQTVQTYLENLFTSDSAVIKEALRKLRRKIREDSDDFQTGGMKFDRANLETTIRGLRRGDLLSEEKDAILREFLSNKEILTEVMDVLNMRFDALERWQWSGNKGIPVVMRRQLNQKYRVFMDEDLLDAILVHRIGMKWATVFKAVFETFAASDAWIRAARAVRKIDAERREYFLGDTIHTTASESVHSKRRSMFTDEYFLTQLPRYEEEGPRAYDDDTSYDDDVQRKRGPLQTKHALLHLLVTEGLLATHIHNEFTVIRSDFKWFGPSLAHVTILTVLKFLGVSDVWLKFFSTFLQAPLRFSQDGPDAEIRTRTRGVPISHALSDVCGEAILFVMDFAVNQATDGQYLYRLHDDFWIWGSKQTCEKGWAAMTHFTSTMGIEFNDEKTGSAYFGSAPLKPPENVPSGDIRWGFLVLDTKSPQFIIDQKQVDEHIEELQRQLGACKSVFAWIQAYNSYFARFFTNNFGQPAFCFGRDHIDMLVKTFARIQQALFPTGSVTDHLRDAVQKQLGAGDSLPDGFFYWPVEMGGLQLKNPFIELLAMRESLRQSPAKIMEKAFDKERAGYKAAKQKFLEDENYARTVHGTQFVDLNTRSLMEQDAGRDGFMTFDQYSHYREEKSSPLSRAYEKLLQVPDQVHVNGSPKLDAELAKLDDGGRTAAFGVWSQMSPYWKWILIQYHEEMVQRFGGLAIVDKGKVPLGVVNMLRNKKVKWLG